jgi:hypothetical protein
VADNTSRTADLERIRAQLVTTYKLVSNITWFRSEREAAMRRARMSVTQVSRTNQVRSARSANRRLLSELAKKRAREAELGVMAEGCLFRRQAGER